MHTAKPGDRVRVRYSRVSARKAPAGTATKTKSSAATASAAAVSEAIVPESKELEFTVGSDEVMPGLSLGVVGMAQGEEKHLTLQPAQAYGPVKPGLIKEIPRHQFPKSLVLRVGKRLVALASASGRRRRVRIVEINPKSVLVDGNHALAGKVVELDVRLISLEPATQKSR